MPVSGSMVLYTITLQSGVGHDFVSVVKILLKASPHSFLQHTRKDLLLAYYWQVGVHTRQVKGRLLAGIG
jgi:hypothetical protein